MAAYPEASIILSLRHSEDAWLASMESTLWHAHVHQPVPNPSPMTPLSDKYHKHCWGNDLPRNGRAAYRAHNELVRQLARANRRKLLEYRPGDGWEPLCEFLGVEGDEVPREPFPKSDDWAGYKRMVEAGREKRRVDATTNNATS